tara:strand:+ start:590 stop:871 length:282 start_codon:yes stop_codon:yes gene_type:complete
MKTKGYLKGGMKTKGYATDDKADKDMSERTYKARVPGMIKKEARSKSSIPMIKKESRSKSPIPMIKKESGSKGAVGSAEMKEFRKMGTMKNNW